MGRHEEVGEENGKDTKAFQGPMTRGRLKRLGEEVHQKMGLLMGQGRPTQNPTLFSFLNNH
ncbi:hypothetical protein CR513_17037, partial [Mucuna pruriens]